MCIVLKKTLQMMCAINVYPHSKLRGKTVTPSVYYLK